MKRFFKTQASKIAWKRLAIIAAIMTVFNAVPKSAEYNNPFGYNAGYFGGTYVLFTLIGAAATKKENA